MERSEKDDPLRFERIKIRGENYIATCEDCKAFQAALERMLIMYFNEERSGEAEQWKRDILHQIRDVYNGLYMIMMIHLTQAHKEEKPQSKMTLYMLGG